MEQRDGFIEFDGYRGESVRHTETGEQFFLMIDPEGFNTETVASGVYKHYKSTQEAPRFYLVFGVFHRDETNEELVLYEALYEKEDLNFHARPVASFLESVIVDGQEKPRFDFVGKAD